MEKENTYFLGSFLGQMIVSQEGKYRCHVWPPIPNKKCVVIPPFYPQNNYVAVRERFKNSNMFCLIADKDQQYDMSKFQYRIRNNHFTDPYSKTFDDRNIYGELVNKYSEIWMFLLYNEYVYMEAEVIGEQVQENKKNFVKNLGLTFVPVKVDVYLTLKAIQDNFELKIRNYGGRTDNQSKSKQNERRSHSSYIHDKNEERDLEIMKFGRLSLLIAFDLLLIQKETQSLIKSKKQFQTFFKTIQNLLKEYIIRNAFAQTKIKCCIPIKINAENQQMQQYYLKSILNIEKLGHKNIVWGDEKEGKLSKFICMQLNPDQFVTFQKILKHVDINNFGKKKYKETHKILKEQNEIQKLQILTIWKENQSIKDEAEKKLNESKQELRNFILNLPQEKFNIDGLMHIQSDIPYLATFLSGLIPAQLLHQFNQLIQRLLQTQFQFNSIDNIQPNQFKVMYNIDDETEINERSNEQNNSKDLGSYDIDSDTEETVGQEKNDIFNSSQQTLFQYPNPLGLLTTLKPHQKEALSWMLYREGKIFKNQAYIKTDDPQLMRQQLEDYEISQIDNYNIKNIEEKKISPLWDKLKLVNGETLYVNTFTGKLSLELQTAQPTKGGILADEMGLGKTVMALALIHEEKTNYPRDSSMAGNLIIVPKSVIAQWIQEIYHHSHPNTLSAHEYYDIRARGKNIKLDEFDIVITTYAILGMDFMDHEGVQKLKQDTEGENLINQPKYKRFLKGKKQANRKQTTENSSDSEFAELVSNDSDPEHTSKIKKNLSKSASPKKRQQNKRDTSKLNNLFNYKWNRVILDEAHNIKTRQSNQSKAALYLNAQNRWCLTGTPIQNKYDDLFSLISFLRVETFGEYFWWNTYINKENDNERDTILKAIVQPILLRRTKQSQDKNGKFILDIEQRDEEIVWVNMSKEEKFLYDKLYAGTKSLFFKLDQNQQVQSQFVHIFQIMGKLRMMCNHPALVLKSADNLNIDGVETVLRNLNIFFVNKNANQGEKQQVITEQYREELIKQIQAGEHDICKICLEDEVSSFLISKCGHIYCRNCFTQAIGRQRSCPSCRLQLTMQDVYQYEKVNKISFEESIQVQKPSSKMVALLEEVKKIKQIRDKCLVFSQWIDMIGLIQKMFEENNIYYLTITGKMAVKKRTDVIQKFKEHDVFTCLILSLKATSTGLNLTMANNVYIVDPWWNPSIEDQAIGRAHRIGQNKKVTVKRFLVKDSIEEKILKLHSKKRLMAQNAIILNEQERKKQDIEQFRQLFDD